MAQIRIRKGLNIPIKGAPEKYFEEAFSSPICALELSSFGSERLRPLVKEGEEVRIGQPLLEFSKFPGIKFVSPAAGKVVKISRGFKRQILHVVIERGKEAFHFENKTLDPHHASRKEILDFLAQKGLLVHIHSRPCEKMALLNENPKSIFVKAIETAPFAPPPELEIIGDEEAFQGGLDVLSKLTDGKVHLMMAEEGGSGIFLKAGNVEMHTVKGPHPAANPSLHINKIDPIMKSQEVVWWLDVHAVRCIGKIVKEGRYVTDRIISIAGEGCKPASRGYYRVQKGIAVKSLLDKFQDVEKLRLISGDPLMGSFIGSEDFLGFFHNVVCGIPDTPKREFLHFLRLGRKKYTATKTYLSAKNTFRDGYSFNTSQHGELRAFVDPSVYEKVMPLQIPTMHLIKALLAEDFEKAVNLGLLKIAPEDFALPAFICPSKIDMVGIVREGLRKYAQEYLQ